jgi:hypothetical protein
LHPMAHVAADGAFVIEQENWLKLRSRHCRLDSVPARRAE